MNGDRLSSLYLGRENKVGYGLLIERMQPGGVGVVILHLEGQKLGSDVIWQDEQD